MLNYHFSLSVKCLLVNFQSIKCLFFEWLSTNRVTLNSFRRIESLISSFVADLSQFDFFIDFFLVCFSRETSQLGSDPFPFGGKLQSATLEFCQKISISPDGRHCCDQSDQIGQNIFFWVAFFGYLQSCSRVVSFCSNNFVHRFFIYR